MPTVEEAKQALAFVCSSIRRPKLREQLDTISHYLSQSTAALAPTWTKGPPPGYYGYVFWLNFGSVELAKIVQVDWSDEEYYDALVDGDGDEMGDIEDYAQHWFCPASVPEPPPKEVRS
jgi:hypothetical protein